MRVRIRLLVGFLGVTGCGARTALDVPAVPVDPCASAPDTPITVSIVHPSEAASFYNGSAIAITPRNGVYFETGGQIGTARTGVALLPLAGAQPEQGQSTLVFPPNSSAPAVDGPLVADPTNFYFSGVGGTIGSLQGYLGAQPLEGGPVSVVKVIASDSVLTDAWAIPTGGVMWLETQVGNSAMASALFLWDGSRTTQIASLGEAATGLVGNADDAFVMTEAHLFDVPLAGGAPIMLRPVKPPSQILGWDGEALFYSPDGTSVVRRDVVSGNERTLLSGLTLPAHGPGGHNGWVDSTSLYYVTDTSADVPAVLNRIGVDGGTPEAIWSDTTHPPLGAVATDACNIYWAVASSPWGTLGTASLNGPSLLMVRAKH